MRILDRYLLREFTVYLLLGLAGFVVIYAVVDIIEKLGSFLDHRASAALIATYYLNLVPKILVQMMPVALLLATFLALGQLNKFGELTAMRAAGISILRILVPVFGVAVIAAVGTLLLSEFVVPKSARECNDILNRRIQQMQNMRGIERTDLTYLGQGGRIWYMRLYIVPERRMHEVSLQEFTRGQLVRRIDASEATWDGSRWVFVSGVKRTFDAQGREVAETFPRLAVGGLAERPEDFSRDDIRPEEMNYFELAAYIQRLRTSGARVANYLVDLHMKLAFPMICVVVVLIGGSLATRMRMQSAALGFGLSIAIAILYYAVMRAGQALGHNGAMPPYLAAWLGDMIFGAIGLFMLRLAQKA